jgi:hypothetical protein
MTLGLRLFLIILIILLALSLPISFIEGLVNVSDGNLHAAYWYLELALIEFVALIVLGVLFFLFRREK